MRGGERRGKEEREGYGENWITRGFPSLDATLPYLTYLSEMPSQMEGGTHLHLYQKQTRIVTICKLEEPERVNTQSCSPLR